MELCDIMTFGDNKVRSVSLKNIDSNIWGVGTLKKGWVIRSSHGEPAGHTGDTVTVTDTVVSPPYICNPANLLLLPQSYQRPRCRHTWCQQKLFCILTPSLRAQKWSTGHHWVLYTVYAYCICSFTQEKINYVGIFPHISGWIRSVLTAWPLPSVGPVFGRTSKSQPSTELQAIW